jgi:hypothetical protein
MKTKDIFNLIIRLLGIVFLYQALEKVPFAFSAMFPAFPHFRGAGLFDALMMVGWPLLVGYWLLRGAPPVARVAYPDEPRST